MADTTQPFADLYWSAPDGVRLHAHDWRGEGTLPPLVCLPGLTRNARDFDALAARLSPRRRVIAVSLRGRGGSGKAPPDTYVPATYVGDVLAMLDQIGADRVAVIGTSLGGLVAMMLAQAAPGRIAGMALNDVGPRLEPVGMSRIRAQLGRPTVWPTWMHAARAVAEGLRDVYPDWSLLDWLAMAKRLYRLNSAGRIVADFDGKIAEAFRLPAAESDSAPAPDPWPLLDALAGVPVLVARGERSDVLGAGTAARMVAAVPGATFATVPRVGHAPTLTEPVAAAAIDRWLERMT
ncbi:alpha/beta fold hydrolase [uncultured Sphingomonas sp.]|uniref:alpha/beta fold hydrolase n=1 Tax=uncultured Sphingomonas sp. TaxID=158754 RepID=UPI0035CC0F5B